MSAYLFRSRWWRVGSGSRRAGFGRVGFVLAEIVIVIKG